MTNWSFQMLILPPFGVWIPRFLVVLSNALLRSDYASLHTFCRSWWITHGMSSNTLVFVGKTLADSLLIIRKKKNLWLPGCILCLTCCSHLLLPSVYQFSHERWPHANPSPPTPYTSNHILTSIHEHRSSKTLPPDALRCPQQLPWISSRCRLLGHKTVTEWTEWMNASQSHGLIKAWSRWQITNPSHIKLAYHH